MLIQLTSRWTDVILYEHETDSIKSALEAAVHAGADLSGANLAGADLSEANLAGALLNGANLAGADLSEANLTGAQLSEANMTATVLRRANLAETDLTMASWTATRDDLWAVLSCAPAEVAGLRDALIAGRINGSVYDHSSCSCLIGTLARVNGCRYDELPWLIPDHSRPAERFFLSIEPGDTPQTSPCAALALAWIETWLENVQAAIVPLMPGRMGGRLMRYDDLIVELEQCCARGEVSGDTRVVIRTETGDVALANVVYDAARHLLTIETGEKEGADNDQ